MLHGDAPGMGFSRGFKHQCVNEQRHRGVHLLPNQVTQGGFTGVAARCIVTVVVGGAGTFASAGRMEFLVARVSHRVVGRQWRCRQPHERLSFNGVGVAPHAEEQRARVNGQHLRQTLHPFAVGNGHHRMRPEVVHEVLELPAVAGEKVIRQSLEGAFRASGLEILSHGRGLVPPYEFRAENVPHAVVHFENVGVCSRHGTNACLGQGEAEFPAYGAQSDHQNSPVLQEGDHVLVEGVSLVEIPGRVGTQGNGSTCTVSD